MSVPYIRRGSEAFFRIQVYDQREEPPILFNPAQGVRITLIDPQGANVASNQAMTNEGTGVYTYVWQTDVVDPLGPWLVSYKIQDGSSITLTIREVAFITTITQV